MEKEQLGQLIIASSDTMYHIAKTLLYDVADCADAIQESIVKAFAKYQTLRKDAYAKTWLIRILINECYSILRQKSRTIPMDSPLAGQPSPHTRDYSDLYEALAALLKTSESSVKNRLLRARKKMRRILEERKY